MAVAEGGFAAAVAVAEGGFAPTVVVAEGGFAATVAVAGSDVVAVIVGCEVAVGVAPGAAGVVPFGDPLT